MQRFAALFESLDTTTSTSAKIDAMVDYFRDATPADAAWATYVLMGRRLKRSIGAALLREWLVEEAALPAWLVEETYGSIGDMAETIALLVAPDAPRRLSISSLRDIHLSDWVHRKDTAARPQGRGRETQGSRRLVAPIALSRVLLGQQTTHGLAARPACLAHSSPERLRHCSTIRACTWNAH